MVRIVPRREVERELANRGCTKIKEYVFGTGALWRTADTKFYFVVPNEIGGWTDEDTLRDILTMLDGREPG
jgi:hypothetical protein